MVTIFAIQSAGAAAIYYSQVDDYYRGKQYAPTQWQGSGAERLGLSGEVDREEFERLMAGDLPTGEQLGRMRNGQREHRPGWDLTFSAPKSVSVAALVHGDERLIEAHDQAVKDTIQWLEQRGAWTRTKVDGETVHLKSDNLTVATYRHSTSRELECQLHTHAVFLNATQADDGKWRSLESRPLYRMQMEAGEFYRAQLAVRCHDLGWTDEVKPVGSHGALGFDLKEISKDECDKNSTRSHQVEDALAVRGKDRSTATGPEKQLANLDTRAANQHVDHAALRGKWREDARAAGYDVDYRPQAPTQFGVRRSAADQAVKLAAEHLSEREARFSREDLERTARREAFGKAGHHDISAAIDRAEAMGSLEDRQVRAYDQARGQKTEQSGYTTIKAVVTEKEMLRTAKFFGQSMPVTTPLTTKLYIEQQEARSGYAFNDAQREATKGVLNGLDRLTLIQGYAGTAKTTSVLAASANAYRFMGYEVHALAPTHSASNTLGEAIGCDGKTVKAWINSKPLNNAPTKQAIIVDEASMLSAKDMNSLLNKASKQNARVVLVGDVKQLGSVEAGAAFRQLQEQSGTKTYVLDNIVRQSNQELKSAVYDAIRGDASAALGKVQVNEDHTREERIEKMVKDYTGLDPEQREKVLVIAPGRDDRAQINEAIRDDLKSRGEIKGIEVKLRSLERKDMTRVEAGQAKNYEVGDLIKPGRRYVSIGMDKGHEARVISVDKDTNRITIQRRDGEKLEINPRNYSRLETFKERQLPVASGDKLIMRENNVKQGISNGETLRVKAIGLDGNLVCADEKGKACQIPIKQGLAVDRGFAVTAHQAQGRTVNKVLYHAESNRINLTNQQAMYVGLSRAKEQAIIYTDNKEMLASRLEMNTGQKDTALDSKLEARRALENERLDKVERERQAEKVKDNPEAKTKDQEHRQEKEAPKVDANRTAKAQVKPELERQPERVPDREAMRSERKGEHEQGRQQDKEASRTGASQERQGSEREQPEKTQDKREREVHRQEKEEPRTEADLERLRAERQVEREAALERAREDRQVEREARAAAEHHHDPTHAGEHDHAAGQEHEAAAHEGPEPESGHEVPENDPGQDYGR